MAVKSLAAFQATTDSEESPAKRHRTMNTPPEETKESDEISRRTELLADIKGNRFPGNEDALAASWERLLVQIQETVRVVTQTDSKFLPEIDFEDIRYEAWYHQPLFSVLAPKKAWLTLKNKIPAWLTRQTASYVT